MTRTIRRRHLLAGSTTGAVGAMTSRTLEASARGRALPAETIAARRRFFGADVVDATGRPRRDRVVLAWCGVANFAMAIAGRVLLLDAWVARGTTSGYVPISVDDLVALAPSHVLIGHGHFDHAADVPTVAAATGAVVVGTAEHCAQAEAQAGRRLATRALLPAGAAEGATGRMRLGRVRVDTVKHVHSTPGLPTGESLPLVPLPDPLVCLEHPPDLAGGIDTLSHQADEEGGALAYRFRVGDFSLVWHDSAGPVRTEAPTAYEVLRDWRGVDVHVGAIQGFGQYTNGLRDPMWYVEALAPRLFVPGHHDNWMPPASAPSSGYEGRLREALAGVPGAQPRLRMLRDPDDYVAPRRLTFRVRR